MTTLTLKPAWTIVYKPKTMTAAAAAIFISFPFIHICFDVASEVA